VPTNTNMAHTPPRLADTAGATETATSTPKPTKSKNK
jgi:hypothetical protein